MSFIDTVKIFIFGRSPRKKKLKHQNLNESNLAKQTYETSSDEEEISLVIDKNKKHIENYSQTGISLESYRDSSAIDSDVERSSISIEEEYNFDDTEVSRTDLELGIEENLENLSLNNNQYKGKLIKFGYTKPVRSQSYESIFDTREIETKKFNSCPSLAQLIKTGAKLNEIRQKEICEDNNKLAVVPYAKYLFENKSSATNELQYRKASNESIKIDQICESEYWNRKTDGLVQNTKTSRKIYRDWVDLQRQVSELKKTAGHTIIFQEAILNVAQENNNIVDKTIGRHQEYLKRKAQIITENMACANTVDLSAETNKILKRLPNISSEDSKSEIRENIEKLRMYGKRIPEKEVQSFIESLATIFDCAIREAVDSANVSSIDELCDFVIKKFVLKGNYDKKLDELKKLKKKKTESYTDFGTRVIKFKNDLIKMAKYKDDDDRYAGRKTNIEDEALKTYLKALRKHLTLVFRYGDPKTIVEAREMVEKAEERFPFSDDESSEDEPKREKHSDVNWSRSFRPNVRKCQTCESVDRENQHEALTCTKSPCAYCGTSFHVTKLCNIISNERKIPMLCKLCSSLNHTIDFCPQKKDNTTYCQYCQSANCYASRCDKMKAAKTCAICGDKDHIMGENCPMNQVSFKNNQPNQIRSQGPCFNCQGPHKIAQCPHRQNQNQQIQPYRDQNRPSFRGGFNRGYQNNNGTRTFYRGGNNQLNIPRQNFNHNNQYQQNRGGYTYRGNSNYRGNNYNPNYRGGYGNPNYGEQRPQNLDLQRMQELFENWLQGNSNNNGRGAQQNAPVPTITFPQQDPKNE